MRIGTKRHLVQASLGVLAAWPLLHIAVVRWTDISPWRGFGWAMYTVPVLPVEVGVRPLEGSASEPSAELSAAVVRATKRYIRRAQALGARAQPDRVAEAIFAAYPGLETIEIRVEQPALDRATACVVPDRRSRYRYGRDGSFVALAAGTDG